MDRGNRLLPLAKSFEEAFPRLELAMIEYRETGDGVFENRRETWTKPHQIRGSLMRCSNPRCERGGYEIDREIINMMLAGRSGRSQSCDGVADAMKCVLD